MFDCQRLRNRRRELGLTLEEVGKIVGLTRSGVQKVENAVVTNITVSKVELFAQALKCNPAWLLDWTDKPELLTTPPDTITLKSPERDLLDKYRSMNEEGQEKIRDYVDDLAASGKYKKYRSDGMGAKEA